MTSRFLVALFLVLGLVTSAHAQNRDACSALAGVVDNAEEHVASARNAWLNRESVCEADLNKENCFEYLKNDYATARAELKQAKRQYRNAGCQVLFTDAQQ